MKKKLWLLISIAILGIVTLLYILLKPEHLDREYSSVVYSNDSGFARSISIKLKGDLYKAIWGNNKFVGQLTADHDFKYKIKLNENDQQYWGMITTFDEMKSIRTIGTVIIAKDLDKVWIKLDDINQRYQLQDGYISGPANNFEEAEQIAREVVVGDEE